MAVKGVAGSLNSPLPFTNAARAVSVTWDRAVPPQWLCAPHSKIADINLEENTRANFS
jgi:hypothetical protein